MPTDYERAIYIEHGPEHLIQHGFEQAFFEYAPLTLPEAYSLLRTATALKERSASADDVLTFVPEDFRNRLEAFIEAFPSA